ncbi:MAG: 3-hydroxyacyl-ACP dehydratase FabZ [Candidatus Omnitrophica bacterium]|nr:3-hydroxyacyl-ACP dehydratase FabZ [Candidatus Omnitrophota bacterium]
MGKEELDIKGKVLDIDMIQKILPHRYPFLFVDKVLAVDDKRVIGEKCVTIDEPFFQGHFPGHPIMPGVLIIEAMAQVAGVGGLQMKENRGKLAYFISINNAKFRKAVLPGDTLRIEVDLLKVKLSMLQVHAVAKVGEALAAEADLMFAFITPNE